MLLSMPLLFSALTAWISMQINMPYLGVLVTLGGYFALLFLTSALTLLTDVAFFLNMLFGAYTNLTACFINSGLNYCLKYF